MDRLRWSPEDELILKLCSRKPVAGFRRPLDWNRFLKTARQHRVAPLVLDRLLRLPLQPADKAWVRAVARGEIVSVIHDNAVFKSELARLVARLREQDIGCILLKGLSLNFSQLRLMGDIDLMVPPELLVEAIDALLAIEGYRYRRMCRDGPNHSSFYEHYLPKWERRRVRAHVTWNNEFQVYNPSTGVLVELHHTPLQDRNPDSRFMVNIDSVLMNTALFWQEKRFDEELGCHVLAPRHSLLLMCLRNAIKHPPAKNAFRLSNLVDIDNLADNGIDWPGVLRDCERLQVAPHTLFSLDLARRLLGTPVPASVLRALKVRCTPQQLRAVDVHRHCVSSLHSSSIFFSKWYDAICPGAFGGTFLERLRSLLLLWIWLPSRTRMADFYRLRKGSPWIGLAYLLNPARWVRRIVEKAIT